MKIAVTYENGNVFQHFGHTEQFKVYEMAVRRRYWSIFTAEVLIYLQIISIIRIRWCITRSTMQLKGRSVIMITNTISLPMQMLSKNT